jgi:hypothetical protein
MQRCAFCPRFAIPGGKWAVTAEAVDGSWRREVVPLCPRCNRLLREAGESGRVLKATGERWFGGHTVGLFEAKGVGRPQDG